MSDDTIQPEARERDRVSRDGHPDADVGLACPACGCRHLPVSYTRPRRGHILRVRVCRHCGKRIPTRERM